MNLSQLYYFKKLSEVLHFTNAAKELYISQPTLSDAIISLENELGVSLFEKHGRSVTLTKAARDFYGYVCGALYELETGISIVQSKHATLGSRIDIGCIPTLLSEFLPDALQGYTQTYENQVDFHIHHGHSHEILQKINSEEYDIGFCAKLIDTPDIIFVPILYQPYVVVTKNTHVLATQPSITLDELRDYHILTYRNSIPIGKNVEPYILAKNISASKFFDDEISICGILLINNAIAIVAKTDYLKQFKDIAQIPISDIPYDAHTIYMAYKSKKYFKKSLESFANYIVAHKLRI